MRGQKTASASPAQGGVSPMMLILGTAGCFALGFAGLMLGPILLRMPRYVAVPVQEKAAPAIPPDPAPVVAAARFASSPLVQEIAPAAAPVKPQAIARLHTLADLSECKAQITTGGTYNGSGAGEIASLIGGNRKALTSQQIDEGCRKILQ